MRPFLSAWDEVKRRAFPPGAVTFHLGAWSRGALTEEEGAAARALLEEFGVERLLVLHGSAIRLREETVVVVGPPAIGKSTACRALVLREGATWLEDGLVLAAESGGRWTLIETGTLAVLRRAALFPGQALACIKESPGLFPVQIMAMTLGSWEPGYPDLYSCNHLRVSMPSGIVGDGRYDLFRGGRIPLPAYKKRPPAIAKPKAVLDKEWAWMYTVIFAGLLVILYFGLISEF